MKSLDKGMMYVFDGYDWLEQKLSKQFHHWRCFAQNAVRSILRTAAPGNRAQLNQLVSLPCPTLMYVGKDMS